MVVLNSKFGEYEVFKSNDLKMLLDFYGCPFEESSGSRSCLVSSIIVGKSVTWESLFRSFKAEDNAWCEEADEAGLSPWTTVSSAAAGGGGGGGGTL